MEVGVQTIMKAVTSISLDVVIVAVLIAIVAFLTMRLGKHRLIAFVLGSYPAYLLYSIVRSLRVSAVEQALVNVYASATFFLVIWFCAFFCIQRYVSASYPSRHFTRLFEALSLGITTSGIVLAFGYKIGAFPVLHTFSHTISQAFAGDIAFLAWLAVPFVVMIVFLRP